MRARARAELGLPDAGRVVLTVGSSYKYAPLPGLDFLDFAREIVHARRDTWLLAVGVAEDERWRAARAETDGRVRALGVKLDLRRYYAAADVYVEGFPFGSTTAVLEAGQHGLPCVLAPASLPPPFGTDGRVFDEGGLSQPPDVQAYTQATLRLLDDPEAREQRSRAFSAAIDRQHTGEGWRARLEAMKARIPSTHEVRGLEQPPPVPWPFVAYWAAFSSRVRADALAIVYRSAVQLGLAPRLDLAMRNAARRARRIRTLHPPLRVLISMTDGLIASVPQAWAKGVYRAYDGLASLLREDGRISRLFRSTSPTFARVTRARLVAWWPK
jgi:hypothetical protein